MTDRNINYRVSFDLSGSKAFESSLAGIHTKVRELDAALRSVGTGAVGGGARPGSSSSGGQFTRTSPGEVQGTRELISRAGYANRLLERIASGIERLGGGVAGGRSGGGGPSFDSPFQQRAEGRITSFIRGSQISQLGHAIGGAEGQVVGAAGQIQQGFAGGGLPGAAVAAVTALVQFGKALNEEAKAAAERAKMRRESAAAAEFDQQRFREARRGQGIVEESILNGGDGNDIDTRKRLIASRMRTIHENRNESNLATSTGQKTIVDEMKEEFQLRQQMLGVLRQEAEQKKSILDIGIRSTEESRRALQAQREQVDQQIAGQKERVASNKRAFGALPSYEQDRIRELNQRLKAGGSFDETDENFARRNRELFGKELDAKDEASADAAGFGEIADRAGKVVLDELERKRGDIEKKIGLTISADIKLDIQKDKIEQELRKQGPIEIDGIVVPIRQGDTPAGAAIIGRATRAQAGGY